MLYEFTEHELLMALPYLTNEQITKIGGILWIKFSSEKNK